MRSLFFLFLVVPLALVSPARAQTGLLQKRSATFFSKPFNEAFLVTGVLLPALDGPEGRRQSVRTADRLVAATLVCTALKALTREKRPDSEERNSFPSGHATAAFAVAVANARYRREQAPFWLAGAFLIADSRVTLRRHYVRDVLAGALLGASGLRTGLRF